MPWWFWPAAVAWTIPLLLIVWSVIWAWWDDRQCERYAASAEARAEDLARRAHLGPSFRAPEDVTEPYGRFDRDVDPLGVQRTNPRIGRRSG